jgi:hypothetical protein
LVLHKLPQPKRGNNSFLPSYPFEATSIVVGAITMHKSSSGMGRFEASKHR